MSLTYKSFDTLYLRQSDIEYLQTMLDRFNSSKITYETLGLSHKLGLLLYNNILGDLCD